MLICLTLLVDEEGRLVKRLPRGPQSGALGARPSIAWVAASLASAAFLSVMKTPRPLRSSRGDAE